MELEICRWASAMSSAQSQCSPSKFSAELGVGTKVGLGMLGLFRRCARQQELQSLGLCPTRPEGLHTGKFPSQLGKHFLGKHRKQIGQVSHVSVNSYCY